MNLFTRITLSFLGLFYSLSLWSQQDVVFIQVKNAKIETEVLEAEVYNATNLDYLGKATKERLYKWDLSANKRVRIKSWGFSDTTLNSINLKETRSGDTLHIYLNPWSENLEEVNVQSGDSWMKKQRFQSFERWDYGWCFMAAKDQFVTDDRLDLLYKQPLLKHGNEYARELFRDAMGNLYLLGKDSVTQILPMDESIYYYPADERKRFDYFIRPLQLAIDENSLLYREVKEENMLYQHLFREVASEMTFRLSRPALHNCGARFELRTKGKKPEIVYQSIDTSKYEKAAEQYGIYMSHYLEFWRVEEVKGHFDPGLKAEMNLAKENYKRFYAGYHEAYWLSTEEGYIHIDPFSKSYVRLDLDFKEIERTPIDLEDCPPEDYIVIDSFTDDLWLKRRKRGLDQLYSMKNGLPGSPLKLKTFTSNIRVHDGVVHFLNEEGYLELLKL